MIRLNSILFALLLATCIAVGLKMYFVLDHADKQSAVVWGEVQHEMDGNNKSSFMHITKKTVGETRDLIGHTSTLVGKEDKYADAQNAKVSALLTAGADFLNDTNRNVNTVLLPKISSSVDASNTLLTATASTVQHLDSGLAPVLQSAAASTHNIEILTADPNIPASFQRLSFTLDQVGQTAANGNAMSLDLRDKVHGILHPKPLTLWRRAGEFGITHLSQLSQIKLGLF